MLYKETVAITADELAWINSMLADCGVKDREEDPCCLDCKRKDFQTWSKRWTSNSAPVVRPGQRPYCF